jgi:hypothetical protein
VENGNARSPTAPGGGYLCDTDAVARYVDITSSTLVHKGTFYESLADIEKAGIRVPLVPGSHLGARAKMDFKIKTEG